MKTHPFTAALLAAACFVGAPAPAAAEGTSTITLTGTLRDFLQSHPDMENPSKDFAVRTGLVKPTLDADGKPVLVDNHDGRRGMITSASSFAQWFRDVPDVNIAVPYSIVLEPHPTKPGVFYFAREKGMPGSLEYFFPLDNFAGACFNDLRTVSTGTHNFYFTYELATEFTYTDPQTRDHPLTFAFTGDDDVWVFINGRLAVDIGGVHGQAHGGVNLDDQAAELGLEPGGNYPLILFFAERHTTQSNFRIETTLQLKEVLPTTTSALFD